MTGILVNVGIVLGLILLAAVFVAAEIALVSLREGQVRAQGERDRRGAAVARLAGNPNRFLAAVQIIVYAGAIVVLFLFVIMLLGVDGTDDVRVDPLTGQRPAAVVAGLALLSGLTAVIVFGTISGERSTGAPNDDASPNVVQIGRLLFTDHLWAFEITSVLLVIAVVGAVVLARHRRDEMVDADLVEDDQQDVGGKAASDDAVAHEVPT
jgi:NADH-quinone oxidoreductase subunit J